MKEHLMTKEYDGEQLNNINEDIMDSLDKLDESKIKHGIVTGKIRVTVQWISENDCDCIGFQHHENCPHWVMGF